MNGTRLMLLLPGAMVLCVLALAIRAGAATPTAQLGHGYDFAGNGKRPGPVQEEVWRAEAPPISSASALRSSGACEAARANLAAVRRHAPDAAITCGNLAIRGSALRAAAGAIERWLAGPAGMPMPVRMFRTRGEDRQGNLHFTGYFTPLLPARLRPDERFRFPLFGMPKRPAGPWPSRAAIDGNGALDGAGLELAWTDDLLELYFLHVQGSGQLEFGPGDRRWIEFAGTNNHPYASLGRHLVDRGAIPAEAISLRAIRNWMSAHPDELRPLLYRNPSYTFFKWADRATRGAAGVPLVAGHSVAADPAMFPIGACLLAEVPELDDRGRFRGYSWRLLFVHDTGGAIRGPGHLDLYHGVGREAGDRAGDLHHYGRVWLLLPRDDEGP